MFKISIWIETLICKFMDISMSILVVLEENLKIYNKTGMSTHSNLVGSREIKKKIQKFKNL